MLIRLGYDIEFNIPQPVAVVALLNVHPSREPDLREPDVLRTEPAVKSEQYFDRFGNRCTRFLAPRGDCAFGIPRSSRIPPKRTR